MLERLFATSGGEIMPLGSGVVVSRVPPPQPATQCVDRPFHHHACYKAKKVDRWSAFLQQGAKLVFR
jgi:hypothetical protein